MLTGWVISVLVIGIIFVSEGSSADQKNGVKGAASQPNAEAFALETVTASEVEYVEGPLAPFYDFLIQRKLFKFCKLLRDAGLDQAIQDLGGFWTVFVPSDTAFFFLPGGTLEELEKNPQRLQEFILYHFVTGDFPSNQIQNEMLVDSVQGSPLRFNIYGQITTVSGAQIIEPDIVFEQGRVYIVDRPLYPIPVVDIVSYLQTHFKELYKLIVDVNLVDYISSGTFTILVPEDEAFDYLSLELKQAIASNISLAERILLNHILPGSVYAGAIIDGMQWETVGGGLIVFTTRRGLNFANDIPVISPDIDLTDGVIHVINRVLLPEGTETDCKCKPSLETKQTGSETSGSSGPSFVQNQQTETGRRHSTQRPFQRLTPKPNVDISGQTQTTSSQDRPQSPPSSHGSSVRKPWSPTRTLQTIRPHPPNQVTRSPYVPPPVTSQPDDDINSVVDITRQPDAGQKKPDSTRTTRYPPPQRRQSITTRRPAQQNVGTQSRYPSPQPTRRPLTTRTYDWNQRSTFEQPNLDRGNDNPTVKSEQAVPTQRPSTPINSWQQRKQVTTKKPTDRATYRPSRPQPQPQRRPTTTRSPYVPSTSSEDISRNQQPFEPSRQQPACRTRQERVTAANRNLPVCSNTPQNGCQNPPYNPTDARPLCPEIFDTECRDPNSPFNPSDRRPVCQTQTVDQDCRDIGQPSYVGDQRPICSTPTSPQTGCKDPASPYNPSDRRPICRTSSSGAVIPSTGEDNPTQGCRRVDEPANTNDRRPLCQEIPQEDCRPFLERPKPGDRRPLCKINGQNQKPNKDGVNEQKKPSKPPQQSTQTPRRQPWQSTTRIPQSWQSSTRSPQSWQSSTGIRQNWGSTTRTPQSWQTTSRTPQNWQSTPRAPQSWQSTTRTPQSWQSTTGISQDWYQTNPPLILPTTRGPQSWQTTRSPQSWQRTTTRQKIGKQPQRGTAISRQPQDNTFQSQPDVILPPQSISQPLNPQSEISSNQQPSAGHISQPQIDSFNQQTQTGRYPQQPHTGRNPSQPHFGTHQTQPPFGTHQSQPDTGPYPSQPLSPNSDSNPLPPQSGSYPTQPQSGRYPSQPQRPQISQPHSSSQPRQPLPVDSHNSHPHSDAHSPQTGSSQPEAGQGQFQPGRMTTAYPQRQPGSHRTQSRFTTQRPTQGVPRPGSGDVRPAQPLVPHGQGHQTGSFTTSPRRPITTTTRVPISVTGTSSTPGEDSRRSLYEIVEDPALLIRGRPVKLTKVFELFHKAGLEDILLSPGPTTVFLPSDDAFSALPKGVIEQLEENPELLRQVLSYHITRSEILPSSQPDSYTVPSLEGTQLVITMLNGGRLILISGAKAVAVTRANNGIFYVINQLLYPLPHHDIVGAVLSRPDLSTLAWMLPLSGLSELLQGENAYTLLAPTDNAFAQLSPVVFEELTRNTTALREILLNHVIDGAHYGREFFTGGTFPSARGGKLKFQVVSYGYQVNEINIKTPEIVTGTGVIHLIDQVLLEDSDLKFFTNLENSVVGEDGSLSNGQDEAGGSQEIGPRRGQNQPNSQQSVAGPTQVGGLQPSTVGSLPVGRIPSQGYGVFGSQRTQVQPQSNGQIFGNQPQTNVGPSQAQQNSGQPAPIPFGGRRQPVHGQPTSAQTQESGQSHGTGNTCVGCHQPSPQPGHTVNSAFGGQQVPTAGQRTHGTFISQRQMSPQTGSHTAPGVNQPYQTGQNGGQPSDVADLARSMGLNQFANWISNTGLLEKVHDGGVYTVFAPTDDAVSSLPEDMVHSIESNPDQVKSILQYHIIPQRLNLNSVTNEETSSTLLQGKSIRFNVYQNSQPNCKQLVTASGTPVGESLATMGSIQVIPVTQVLYQPTGNLLKIIESSPILQKLNEAVKSASLTWVLSGTGPITIFAPSDTAFESLSEEQRRTLIENKQAFSDLLKRHMVRGTLFSSGVQEDVEKRSENNKPLKLSLQEGILTVNSVPVTYADITATNGVLHVIDHFL